METIAVYMKTKLTTYGFETTPLVAFKSEDLKKKEYIGQHLQWQTVQSHMHLQILKI